jgi:hypothetical protein
MLETTSNVVPMSTHDGHAPERGHIGEPLKVERPPGVDDDADEVQAFAVGEILAW